MLNNQQDIASARHKIRIVTATSLFDGHDVSINIMRRLMQGAGAEVIHLGHNRSASEIADCAIQEDVQAVAVTSYQGGHMEFFKYLFDLLRDKAPHIKIFGGGGGTIVPEEIEELQRYGIAKIYTPDDGMKMGLQGMINDLLRQCDFPVPVPGLNEIIAGISLQDHKLVSGALTIIENELPGHEALTAAFRESAAARSIPVLGITGTGGSGKSSLTDEMIRRMQQDFPNKSILVLSVDPSKRKTGGALLGDRIRMNAINHPSIFMRSVATRQANAALNKNITELVECGRAAFDLVLLETSGIGQSDSEVAGISDVSVYVMTPEYGAATQLEKIDMIDFADLIVMNKSDKTGAQDALRDVRKQYRRSRNVWDKQDDELPVFATIASLFNEASVSRLYESILDDLKNRGFHNFAKPVLISETMVASASVIVPPHRSRYLAEIAEQRQLLKAQHHKQCDVASKLYQLEGAMELLKEKAGSTTEAMRLTAEELKQQLDAESQKLLEGWPALSAAYAGETFEYKVRDNNFRVGLKSETLSGIKISKISLPSFKDRGDLLQWMQEEHLPGHFPYTSGVFPFKREGESPTRMFAGEGGPEQTNRRFHYLSAGQKAKRLSTAFDSVTLYGEDPDRRQDIFGKIGNSGVSVATLDDMKKLYSGFNLLHPDTSVSMTINGPAPMLLAFFMNAAIDQQCELYMRKTGMEINVPDTGIQYLGDIPASSNGLGLALLGTTGDKVMEKEAYEKIKAATLSGVRGTVQADILKEEQAQNTCIFSTEFALKMMGDVQEYFITKEVRNFYSVSISGYHIAEAGANPVTQLAFTLANAFTYVEYYLSRGMHIDAFAPNFSFFFSNGMDAEYSVIGRVARRIWARAIRHKYMGNERSQKLKYHIQTSGRSLHAQEIAFNDIRTTLQALYAVYDNCNSLHTNAYDEAVTTPTEESVRRAVAIQMIIQLEAGLMKNENPLQGAFVIKELTDLVEEAVMLEFKKISERGGVMGAMERMYQRSKIQEESMYYETLKHEGKIPIVGVNTFLDPSGTPSMLPGQLIRAELKSKEHAIHSLNTYKLRNEAASASALKSLRRNAQTGGNIFETLMEAAKVCTLGQMTHALYDAGGEYRRNM